MFLIVAGLLLVGARVAWQALFPMAPADFKGLLYIRDYVTLLPAALCWYLAILRAEPDDPIDRTLYRAQMAVAWLRQRPALIVAGSSLAITLGCMALNVFVFRTRAQISDECAYLFQAKILASGRLWVDPPEASAEFFRATGVAIAQGKWFGGYYPGHAVALAAGVLLRAPFVINPVLSGVLLALTVWAGRRLFNRETGLLAGALMLCSPFAWLQGSSYFSHVLSAVFMLPAVVLILTFDLSSRRRLVFIGLCIGGLLLCRPYSAVLLGVYIAVFWIWQALSGRVVLGNVMRAATWVFIGFIPCALIILAYNRALTGDPLLTPLQVAYGPDRTLEALRIGRHIFSATSVNVATLSVMLLGVPLFSLAAPAACFLLRDRAWLGPIAALVLVYMLGYAIYPFHGVSYGPRYYFELLPFLLIMSACGLRALPGLLSQRLGLASERSARCVVGFCAAGAVISLIGVLPTHLAVYHARAARFDIRGLVEREVRSPAIVFITNWKGNKLEPALAGYQLNDIDLEGPVIFARDLGHKNPELLAAYPGRNAYVLDLDEGRVWPSPTIRAE